MYSLFCARESPAKNFQDWPHRKSVKKVFLVRKPFGEIGALQTYKSFKVIPLQVASLSAKSNSLSLCAMQKNF